MISFSGIGSGLDLESLIGQLLTAEAQPAQARMTAREATLQAELSALGSLKGALASFRDGSRALADVSRLLRYSAQSSDPAVLAVSAGTVKQEATFGIEVKALAATQRLASGGFNDVAEPVGSGTITLQRGRYDADAGTFTQAAGSSPITIELNAGNNSLAGLRDALQQAGIHANVIHDGSAYRLALGPANSGLDHSLKISVVDDDGNDLDQSGLSRLAFDPAAAMGAGRNLTETIAAADAELVVDGLSVSRSGNRIEDLIPGLSLDLKQAAPGQTLSVSVAVDRAAVAASIAAFVKSYNDFVGTARALTAASSDAAARGPLVGDASVRGLLAQLRREISDSVVGASGSFRTLTDLGIRTALDGTLTLDSGRLDKALEADHLAVASLFAQVASADDALVSVASADPALPAGSYALTLTQLASSGRYGAGALTSLVIDADNDALRVEVDGVASGSITLSHGSHGSGAELASALQTAVNADANLRAAGVAIRVDFDAAAGKLLLSSASMGSGSTIAILEADSNSAATLGLAAGSGSAGQDVVGSIGGQAALGSGRILTGTGQLSGLSLDIQGGLTGGRGAVSVTGGLAGRLQSLMDQVLASDGALAARSNGINVRIGDLGAQRQQLDLRLDSMETRLRAQFGALDQLVASLTATGTYLTQQLASLPGFVNKQK